MNLENLTQKVTCHRCNGQGTIPELLHVQNGVCFTCGGTGRLSADECKQTELEHHCDMITDWLESVLDNKDISTHQLMLVYLPKKLGDRVHSLVAHDNRIELQFETTLNERATITLYKETDRVVCH